jgi:putative FmdB family regulatory protein
MGKIVICKRIRGARMPVYTYRCENCGVQFEKMQKFTDPQLIKCPECGKTTLQKVYTPVGIVFKGSGFYATDHRSPSGATSAAKDKKEEKAVDTKPETTAPKETPAAQKTPAPASTPASE